MNHVFPLVVLAACLLLPQQPTVGREARDALPSDVDIRLAELDCIWIPSDPLDAERSMAAVLQEKLQTLIGVQPTIRSTPVKDDAQGILLGRRVAVRSGMITEAELEAVRFDGFVIKASCNRIALAGYAPQGTIYATYALLRRMGLRLYPWRNFGVVEICAPPEDGRLKPLAMASKPFFSRRALLGYLDTGRWGASLREYGLGEFRFVQDHEYFKGKGWLGGDHTAPYLVPMAKYYDTHPEYFAMKNGQRIPKDTENARVALCLSNPEVHRIAAERALEWMAIQHQRRFFHVTDGDTGQCRCAECTRLDPDPDSYTDRYLTWVNSVARETKEKYPNNVILALAYADATRPPVRVKPESNVVVMYCPWYWTSRTTSATSWANPLNVTAMKEFMAWAMLFPDQMGLYDYPGSWVYGQAERIKFLAKHDARVFYSCGGHGDLYQWVNARLLWDPFLNTEDLVDEFVGAYYGPAAEPLRCYFQLRQKTIEDNLVHTRHPFRAPAFLQRTRELMRQAERLSQEADMPTRARILDGVLEGFSLVLSNTYDPQSEMQASATPETRLSDLKQLVALSKQLQEIYEDLGNRHVARVHKDQFRKRMASLGISLPPPEETETADGVSDPFSVARRLLDEPQEESQVAASPEKIAARASVTVGFDAADEAGRWLSDGSQADLITPPTTTAIACPGGQQAGVGIRAGLTRLPIIDHHQLKIHAGRFYAERVFDPPLDVSGCCFVDFHVHASCDLPITIYINKVHSDVDLAAGEQIVRVDMRNFDSKGRFTYADWDKTVRRIGFDIWPQDNYYPYPEVEDARIVFFSMTAGDRRPTPNDLPHRGKAIWLSQFRSNLKRGVTVPRELYDQYMQRQHYRHVGLDYGSRWISEGFRTFTEHRTVTPVFSIAISIGASASAEQRKTAEQLQGFLTQMFGVRLPIQPATAPISRHTGNAILLGEAACRAAERIREQELRHVGSEGFVINAHRGSIAIAGPNDDGTSEGVARYLEDHRVQFFADGRIAFPDLRDDFLHELYLLDWPCFRNRPVSGIWQMVEPSDPVSRPASDSQEATRAMAEAIKNVARAGGNTLPPALGSEISRSPLSRHVAARLLWNPFADATRLIREFE